MCVAHPLSNGRGGAEMGGEEYIGHALPPGIRVH